MGSKGLRHTYTKTPVTTEAINVPKIANVTMAPKFEKNGFCQYQLYKYIRNNFKCKNRSSRINMASETYRC